VAKSVAHRRSLGAVPTALNSGRMSICSGLPCCGSNFSARCPEFDTLRRSRASRLKSLP
jgi:hypothetical protein